MEREVNAVDNEFTGVLQSDFCRLAQLRVRTGRDRRLVRAPLPIACLHPLAVPHGPARPLLHQVHLGLQEESLGGPCQGRNQPARQASPSRARLDEATSEAASGKQRRVPLPFAGCWPTIASTTLQSAYPWWCWAATPSMSWRHG